MPGCPPSELLTDICFYSLLDVLAQAFAVYPWLNAVVVTHVEEIKDVGQITAVKSIKNQNIVFRRQCYCNCVIKNGRGVICAPIDRVDTHRTWCAYDWLYILHIAD